MQHFGTAEKVDTGPRQRVRSIVEPSATLDGDRRHHVLADPMGEPRRSVRTMRRVNSVQARDGAHPHWIDTANEGPEPGGVGTSITASGRTPRQRRQNPLRQQVPGVDLEGRSKTAVQVVARAACGD